MLQEALPRLTEKSGIRIVYSELCGNDSDMTRLAERGVIVDRHIGIKGSGILSKSTGLHRILDLVKSVPRIVSLIGRLRRTIPKYDAIYVHSYRDLLLIAIASVVQSGSRRPRIIWHCHGANKGSSVLYDWAISRCSAIIAISKNVVSKLVSAGVPSEKIHLIYNSSAITHQDVITSFDGGIGLSESSYVVLLPCAAIREEKGVRTGLNSLKFLSGNIHLWITGSSVDPVSKQLFEELSMEAEQQGVSDRLHFIGLRDDIYNVMSRADIVIVPSLVDEGFGLVAAEAMLLGRPVIVSDRGALPEVVPLGCGLRCIPDDPVDLAMKIRWAFDNEEESCAMAFRGQQWARECFTYEKWTESVTHVLKK